MKKEVDIVLSGSGVKMTAFAGALLALEEEGYIVKRICGTSGGSIVASLYAFGYTPSQIFDIIKNFNYVKMLITGLIFPIPFASLFRWGLFSSYPLYKELVKHIGKEKMNSKSLLSELVITGANLDKGKVVYFDKNANISVAKAARISSTVPFGYSYVKHDGQKYVDGGLLNNYPINIFDDNVRPTIGFLSKSLESKEKVKARWPWQYFMSIISACMSNAEKEHIKSVYWAKTIPLDVSHITRALNPFIKQSEHDKLFKEGYNITKKHLALRESK